MRLFLRGFRWLHCQRLIRRRMQSGRLRSRFGDRPPERGNFRMNAVPNPTPFGILKQSWARDTAASIPPQPDHSAPDWRGFAVSILTLLWTGRNLGWQRTICLPQVVERRFRGAACSRDVPIRCAQTRAEAPGNRRPNRQFIRQYPNPRAPRRPPEILSPSGRMSFLTIRDPARRTGTTTSALPWMISVGGIFAVI